MRTSKVKELVSKALEIANDYDFDFDYFGVRFEDKSRDLNDIITDTSRFNDNREDERDFPVYGSEEYENLPTTEGISVWSLEQMRSTAKRHGDKICKSYFMPTGHCYLLGSNELDYYDCMDDGEVILVNAKVLERFW